MVLLVVMQRIVMLVVRGVMVVQMMVMLVVMQVKVMLVVRQNDGEQPGSGRVSNLLGSFPNFLLLRKVFIC